jgi:WD40 repeat protein
MTQETKTPTTIDLHLNKDEDEIEDHPRRLLRVPGTGELLAWGGDTGAIRAILTEGTSATTATLMIRHWDEDDDVRAVAVSHDGTRIAVGFDSGSTVIYSYSSDEILAAAAGKQHPFCYQKPSPKHCQAGPTFSAAIRDLQFYPNSLELLAVATEEGLCVLDLSQNNQERYLQEEAAKHHDDSGIRGIAFSPDGSIMASLAMDGRLCLWDTPGNKPAASSAWKLKHREKGRCVTKKDNGELLGADAWDRACRPHFRSNEILAVPGETYLQLRHCQHATETYDQALEAGHVESIVAMASKGSHLLSTGRDKRVILWSIAQEVRVRSIDCVESRALSPSKSV